MMRINLALHFLSEKMLTRREFTANSRAAFVSEGPLCTGKKELEEGYLFHSNLSNENYIWSTQAAKSIAVRLVPQR